MLTIKSPCTYKQERQYIISVLFGDFLGLNYKLIFGNNDCITITDGRTELRVADIFFQIPEKKWLTHRSLPREPLKTWDIKKRGINCGLSETKIPIIFGCDTEKFLGLNYLPVDIFGSAFFMLTRYEELFFPERDEHSRFSKNCSLAFRNNFLHRPILNEYLEILWAYIHRLWPGLKRKPRSFRILPSHDVDIPFQFLLKSLWNILLKSGGDIYYRKSLRMAANSMANWINVKYGAQQDPYDTFDWILEITEKAGLKAVFNFMSGGRLPLDHFYAIKNENIQGLLKNILQRGHEIGFHPSYRTFSDGKLWRAEFEQLKVYLDGYRIRGGRQHYLRFNVPVTWRYWSENGLEYDSTLSFADYAGFRCGICFEYPVFDLLKRRELPLKERPLIVMDRTVIDKPYMNLGSTPDALNFMMKLKKQCMQYAGDFVVLWHNQRFVDRKEREIYRALIGAN